MNKRGEIYILAAIILATILYNLGTTANYLKQEKLDDDFEKISKNYELEASKVINTLISTGNPDINGSFNVFTVLFTAYSKSQNPSYGTIYTLSFEDQQGNDKLQIGNYLDREVIIDLGAGENNPKLTGCFEKVPATLTFDGFDLGPGINQEEIATCTLLINYIKYVRLGIQEEEGEITWYNLEIIKDSPQIVIINRLEEGEQRQVFIGGEGFVKFWRSVLEEATCVEKTCEEIGAECGSHYVGCETTKNCGTCEMGYNCVDGKCKTKCLTCEELEYECGRQINNCGEVLFCGNCYSYPNYKRECMDGRCCHVDSETSEVTCS